MANTRRAIEDNSGETREAIDANFDDISQRVNEQADEEAEMLAEFGKADGANPMHFHIMRVLKESRKRPRIMEGTAADFPIIPKLRDRFGGGDFEVWIFKNGKLFSKREVSVEAPRIVATTGNPNEDALSQAMRDQGELLRRLVDRETRAPEAPRAPFDIKDLPALITAGAAAFTAIRAAFPPPPPPSDPIDTISKIAEVAQMFNSGAGDRETGFLDIVNTLVKSPALEGVLQQIQTNQNAQPKQLAHTPQLAQPARIIPTPGIEEPQNSVPPADPTQVMIIGQLRYLLTRARKGSDPTLYADMLLDQEDFAPYIPLLAAPDALNQLSILEPGIVEFRDWFEELIYALTNPGEDGQEEDAGDNEIISASAHVSEQTSSTNINTDAGRQSGRIDDAQTDESARSRSARQIKPRNPK